MSAPQNLCDLGACSLLAARLPPPVVEFVSSDSCPASEHPLLSAQVPFLVAARHLGVLIQFAGRLLLAAGTRPAYAGTRPAANLLPSRVTGLMARKKRTLPC